MGNTKRKLILFDLLTGFFEETVIVALAVTFPCIPGHYNISLKLIKSIDPLVLLPIPSIVGLFVHSFIPFFIQIIILSRDH